MTPLQQFRLWARRASTLERLATAVAGVAVIGLLGWAVLPVATGSAPGAAAGPVELSYADLTGGSAAPVSVAPPDKATTACEPPPADADGVTDDSIDVAVALVDLGGAAGNATFGLASVEDQKAAYQAVADDINAKGGAACRKLALHFYNANGSSVDLLHQTCLSILQDKPFVVLDVGGFQSQTSCITDARVPFFTNGTLLGDVASKHPYLFARQAAEVALRNSLFALESLQYFEGDPTVGVVYSDCQPTLVDEYFDWLADLGFSDSDVVTYDLGCTAGFSTSESLQQAVLKFKREGVTRLLPLEMAKDFANFTKAAQDQQFTPKYGVSGDDGVLDITYGLLGPDLENLKGSIAVSASGFGEERSEVTPDVGTAACNALMSTAGLAPVYEQEAGMGGLACTQLWELQVILGKVTTVSRTSLADGLAKAGPLPYSYPAGPTSNTDPRVTFGGQYWRAMEFREDCRCWRLLDSTFKPGFP